MQLVYWTAIACTQSIFKSGFMEMLRTELWEATLSTCARAFDRAYRTFEKKEKEEEA